MYNQSKSIYIYHWFNAMKPRIFQWQDQKSSGLMKISKLIISTNSFSRALISATVMPPTFAQYQFLQQKSSQLFAATMTATSVTDERRTHSGRSFRFFTANGRLAPMRVCKPSQSSGHTLRSSSRAANVQNLLLHSLFNSLVSLRISDRIASKASTIWPLSSFYLLQILIKFVYSPSPLAHPLQQRLKPRVSAQLSQEYILMENNEEQRDQMCYDCQVNKADPTILGYYEVCRPCYELVVQTMLEYKRNRAHRTPEISKIQERVYLGNEDAATDRELLKTHKIDAVLVCGSYLDSPFQEELTYKKFSIADDPKEQILGLLDEAIAFIEENTKQGKTVFVHCAAGISRSASFVIAYIMKTKKLPYEQSHKFVKEKRSVIYPNSGFISQLRQYEKKLMSEAK